MNDHELLELAAKAAEIFYYDIDDEGVIEYGANTISGFRYWNPLDDDGDALRLAVKLNLFQEPAFTLYGLIPASIEQDPYAATRRAIVRAAAAIGRRTK